MRFFAFYAFEVVVANFLALRVVVRVAFSLSFAFIVVALVVIIRVCVIPSSLARLVATLRAASSLLAICLFFDFANFANFRFNNFNYNAFDF